MAQLTIDRIIELGDISVPLSSDYQANGALFGTRLTFNTPSTIAIVTDALRWQWEGFQDEESVRGVANYLYWLCGKFAVEGQYIITGTGGGSVVPINPGATPNPIEFEVTGSSYMINGQSTITIDQYVGYNLLFVRNNIPQSIINMGGSYFSWNKVTGQFTCSPAASTGELFQLYPFI